MIIKQNIGITNMFINVEEIIDFKEDGTKEKNFVSLNTQNIIKMKEYYRVNPRTAKHEYFTKVILIRGEELIISGSLIENANLMNNRKMYDKENNKKVRIVEMEFQNENPSELEILEKELRHMFNMYSMERYYNNTPDFELAKYVINCLEQFKNKPNIVAKTVSGKAEDCGFSGKWDSAVAEG